MIQLSFYFDFLVFFALLYFIRSILLSLNSIASKSYFISLSMLHSLQQMSTMYHLRHSLILFFFLLFIVVQSKHPIVKVDNNKNIMLKMKCKSRNKQIYEFCICGEKPGKTKHHATLCTLSLCARASKYCILFRSIYSFFFFSLLSTHQFNRIDNAGVFMCATHLIGMHMLVCQFRTQRENK